MFNKKINKFKLTTFPTLKPWLGTTDHKLIGIMYIVYGALGGVVGTFFSLWMRLELSQSVSVSLNSYSKFYLGTTVLPFFFMILFILLGFFMLMSNFLLLSNFYRSYLNVKFILCFTLFFGLFTQFYNSKLMGPNKNYLLLVSRLILLSLFGIFFSFQLGLDFEFNHYLVWLVPNSFLQFIFRDYYLWALPFIFMLFWLLHTILYLSMKSFIGYLSSASELGQSLRNVFNKYSAHFVNILKVEFPISIIAFSILLLHTTNGFFNSNIVVNLYNVFQERQSLLSYTTYNTPIIIILSFLLIISFIFYTNNIFGGVKNFDSLNLLSIIFSFIGLFFVMLSLFLCNNLLLLIFLLECVLLLLLNLIRFNYFSRDVGTFLKSVLIFLIPQAIATVIFCYGLSIIYLEEPSLNYTKVSNIIRTFSLYFFETHQFIMSGSVFLILSLLIKMGLGPLGIWIFSAVNSFNYPFLALYFSFIKPLYFIILVKMVGNMFSTLYSSQGFISHPTHLSITDPTLLEYFKFSLRQSSIVYNSLTSDLKLTDVLLKTDMFRDSINSWILAFSLFSVIVGALGLLWTTNFKKFIVFSSLLNYGFVFYPIISGYFTSVHFSILYILIYSFINISFIILFAYVMSENHNSITNLTAIPQKFPLLSLFLITLVISMAGLPPFIGFFAKLTILLELVKILGGVLGAIFILFTLIGAFGYARIIKNMYGFNYVLFKNSFTSFRVSIKNFSVEKYSLSFAFVLFVFSLLFIFNTFCGIFIYVSNPNNFTIFNSFVFITDSAFDNNVVYQYYFKAFSSEFNIDANELLSMMKDLFIKDTAFVEDALNQNVLRFIEKQKILTGTTPTIDEVTEFKDNLRLLYKEGIKSWGRLSEAERYADLCSKSYNAFSKK